MDKLVIAGLRLRCILGVRPSERIKKRTVVVNIEISSDFSKAAESDDLADAIDYSILCKKIAHFVETSRFKLIEALAGGIAELCLKDRRIKGVKVRVEKPGAVKSAANVGIEAERFR